ncbi:hypothetical protein D3C86_1989460 [compost metagenome]
MAAAAEVGRDSVHVGVLAAQAELDPTRALAQVEGHVHPPEAAHLLGEAVELGFIGSGRVEHGLGDDRPDDLAVRAALHG